MFFQQRGDGEAGAFLADGHFGEDLIVLECLEGDEFSEGGDVFEIDEIPTGLLLGGLGIEILAVFLEGGGIWVRCGGDFCDFSVRISQEARVGFMEGIGRCSGPSSRPVMEGGSDSIASSTSSSGLKSAAW